MFASCISPLACPATINLLYSQSEDKLQGTRFYRLLAFAYSFQNPYYLIPVHYIMRKGLCFDYGVKESLLNRVCQKTKSQKGNFWESVFNKIAFVLG